MYRALLAAQTAVSAPGCQPPDTPDKLHYCHSSKKDAQSAWTPGQDHEVGVELNSSPSLVHCSKYYGLEFLTGSQKVHLPNMRNSKPSEASLCNIFV